MLPLRHRGPYNWLLMYSKLDLGSNEGPICYHRLALAVQYRTVVVWPCYVILNFMCTCTLSTKFERKSIISYVSDFNSSNVYCWGHHIESCEPQVLVRWKSHSSNPASFPVHPNDGFHWLVHFLCQTGYLSVHILGGDITRSRFPEPQMSQPLPFWLYNVVTTTN